MQFFRLPRSGIRLSFDSFPAVAKNGLGTVSDIFLLGNILRPAPYGAGLQRSSPDLEPVKIPSLTVVEKNRLPAEK